MKYFQRTQNSGSGLPDNDPLIGVANLFDLGLVFIDGLLLALFGTYHLEDLLRQDSQVTITKESSNGEMELITKKVTKIEAIKVTKETAQGEGLRLGVAYRLKNGSMVDVPEKENPATDNIRQ